MYGYVDSFKAYFKQAREELAVRICERLFDADGSKNKWWQVYNSVLLLLLMMRTWLSFNFDRFNVTLFRIFHTFMYYVNHIFCIIIVIFEEEIHGQGVERLNILQGGFNINTKWFN